MFVFDADITDGAKLLYAYLVGLSDLSESNGKNYVFASAETMAKRQRVTRRTAKSRLYELEKAGFIRVERRKGQTSKVFLTSENNCTSNTESSEKNCTTTSEKNCTTTSAKNYTLNRKSEITRVDIGKHKNKIDGHIASYDSDAYREKAQGPIEYKPREGA